EDLRQVEDRVRSMSAEVVGNLRDHLRREMGEFHVHAGDAGNRLQQLSEELLQVQQQALAERHQAALSELDQVRAVMVSESSRLRADVADLNGRIAKLNESARQLEAGLDVRLSKLASNTVSSARTELENTVDVILEELEKRSSHQLEQQVDKASARLGVMQNGIENAVAQSVEQQAARSLEEFEKNLGELAGKSVERCREALASGLSSLVRGLGEQFRLD
ncbi:MAG TPA: hypothetical protein VJQ82_23625, partial [Terriglobales bacterium]|nr:hypothetical protein [Terriglobales bacterium]